MAHRLFHAIVLVGTGMTAACASRDAPTPIVDSSTTTDTGTGPTDTGAVGVDTSGIDSFPGIMPMMIDSGSATVDLGVAD